MKRALLLVVLVCAFGSVAAFAETINILTVPSSGSATAVVGGVYRVTETLSQSTGSGVINPFLGVQSNDFERGYSCCDLLKTSGLPLDDKNVNNAHTHAITLGDIPVVTIGGVKYYEFLLDANQNTAGQSSIVSLNQVQI